MTEKNCGVIKILTPIGVGVERGVQKYFTALNPEKSLSFMYGRVTIFDC